jgi:hypothetical protein
MLIFLLSFLFTYFLVEFFLFAYFLLVFLFTYLCFCNDFLLYLLAPWFSLFSCWVFSLYSCFLFLFLFTHVSCFFFSLFIFLLTFLSCHESNLFLHRKSVVQFIQETTLTVIGKKKKNTYSMKLPYFLSLSPFLSSSLSLSLPLSLSFSLSPFQFILFYLSLSFELKTWNVKWRR